MSKQVHGLLLVRLSVKPERLPPRWVSKVLARHVDIYGFAVDWNIVEVDGVIDESGDFRIVRLTIGRLEANARGKPSV
jgi:hypothetical protein